jgi:hypothetical protein
MHSANRCPIRRILSSAARLDGGRDIGSLLATLVERAPGGTGDAYER